MSKLYLILFLVTGLLAGETYFEYGERVELTPLEAKHSASLTQMAVDGNCSIRYFEKPNAQIVGVCNTIIAKCIDAHRCANVMQNHAALTFETISKDIYLIYLENPQEIFDISVKLYEEGCFEYVHPNFYKHRRLR